MPRLIRLDTERVVSWDGVAKPHHLHVYQDRKRLATYEFKPGDPQLPNDIQIVLTMDFQADVDRT